MADVGTLVFRHWHIDDVSAMLCTECLFTDRSLGERSVERHGFLNIAGIDLKAFANDLTTLSLSVSNYSQSVLRDRKKITFNGRLGLAQSFGKYKHNVIAGTMRIQ